MTRIDIADLKERLEEFIARARAGEPVVVTLHGEPVAELLSLSPVRLELLRRAETGELSWNGGKPRGLRGIVLRGEPLSDTLIRNRR